LSNNNVFFSSILNPSRIHLQQSVSSKKKALDFISVLFANKIVTEEVDIDAAQSLIIEALAAREKLGSTGLENGIAIPHCRIAGCSKPYAALTTLTEAIDFDTRDNQPVDLLWALIVPEEAANEHLQILSGVVELLSQPQNCVALRQATDAQQLFNQLCDGSLA